MMSRLLGDWKKPKPRPHTASRQTSEAGLGSPILQRNQDKASRHHQKPDAAEDSGDEAIGEASGDRRDDGGRDRPGRHEKSGRRGGAAQDILEIKRQGHQGEALRAEGRNRRRERKREHRPAQKIDRQERRWEAELPPDEDDAERRPGADLDQRGRQAPALARCD